MSGRGNEANETTTGTVFTTLFLYFGVGEIERAVATSRLTTVAQGHQQITERTVIESRDRMGE